MAKAWMPFYVADYLADTGHLSHEEHGIYLLALMHYWQTNQPLTANANVLLRVCRCFDAAKFELLWGTVSQFFELRDGFWHHERMDREIAKAHKITVERSKAGKKGAKAKATANGKQLLTQSQSQSHSNNKPKVRFSDGDMKLAVYIWGKIKELDPKRSKPNLDNWANSVRLMRERDGVTDNEILAVFNWANSDSFWRSNILSVDKLREKFSDLRIRMQAGQGKGGNKRPMSGGNGGGLNDCD